MCDVFLSLFMTLGMKECGGGTSSHLIIIIISKACESKRDKE